jgi:hypothetical protein
MNPNWGGWHGKLPKEGFHVVRQRRRAGKVLIKHETVGHVGFRIGFKGNRGLEAKLRADLGMGEDDEDYDSQRVKDLLHDRALDEQAAVAMTAAVAAEALESEADQDSSARSEKQKQRAEREQDRRVKDKAVQREQKARAKAKGLME